MQKYGNRFVGDVHPAIPVAKCEGHNCISIGYSIIGDEDPTFQSKNYAWIDEIMRNVAEKNNLEFEKDVKKLSVGSVDTFFNYIEDNPN